MTNPTTLTITRPDDWHLHLRDGTALAAVLPDTARRFGRAIVMPNLKPPVTTVALAAEYRARILAALAIGGIVFGLMIRENPLFTGSPVVGPFFNFILLGYGIPAVLTALLARVVRTTRPQAYYFLTAGLAIVLMLFYLTLEVRTLFHGPVLTAPFISDAEHYTYSIVWLAFGVALLLAGIALQSQPARPSPTSRDWRKSRRRAGRFDCYLPSTACHRS